MNWLLVFVGGGLGSVARYGVSQLLQRFYSGSLPAATFLSNVLSCIVLGLVVMYLNGLGETENRMIRLAVLIGFCGGFSTFSTFSFETIQLIKNGNHLVAAGNVIISVTICLILLFKLTKLNQV